MKTGIIIAIILLLLFCLCCLGLTILGAAGYIFYQTVPMDINLSSTLMPFLTIEVSGASTPTPVVIRPTYSQQLQGQTATPQPTQGPNTHPLPTSDDNPTAGPTPVRDNGPLGVPTDTLFTLQQAIVPTNDVRELAQRLEDKGYIPETLEPPPAWYRVGAQETFWVTNVDNNENFQVDATLQYVTDHSYFWIEDSVDFDPDDLRSLAETFENDIYPTDREFFGSEWTPGVDGDPHVYILYASGLGFNLAGYFSSADEYTPLAHEYSNAHEMFLLNADNIGLDETFTYGVLAHEFQHMIHWYRDRNESSWLNEGFSELAALLNGYYDSGFDWVFAQDPDLQLNDWPNDSDATTPHYGAGFLFVTYFLDRFGEEATQALVGDANNDLTSVDDVLASISATDDLSGQPVRADDVVLDWMLTNYIQDSSVGDGRYNYYSYNGAPSFYETEQFYRCPVTSQTRSVHQYGADYIGFNCDGNYTLHFEGSIQTGVLETDPHSGTYAFWSNKGDESDMTLTQSFDFTNQAGPLSISYWTWYDLEKDYDYLYLEASLDGENWQILTTPSGTPEDPSGNSYGWGYNGLSGGGDIARWIQETIDISQFAGQVVQLRFEYVTDAAVNGEGLLLDDISIPEIGYFSDFEADNGGWDAAGWVRIQNILPQTFRLALIKLGRQTTVEYIPLNPDVSADIPLNIGGDIDEVILVVTGTTRFTRQPAAYRFEVLP